MTILLLAALALQLPAGEMRLDCMLTDRAAAAAAPTRLALTLDVRGRRIASARIDGPPLFSSTQGLQVFSGSPDASGGLRIESSQPSPRQLRWTATLRDGTIALSRQTSRIILSPVEGEQGVYAGTWLLGPTRVGGNFFMEGSSGAIRCQASAAVSASSSLILPPRERQP
jgi:hypothetical protein